MESTSELGLKMESTSELGVHTKNNYNSIAAATYWVQVRRMFQLRRRRVKGLRMRTLVKLGGSVNVWHWAGES